MLPNLLCMLVPALHYFHHSLVFAAGDFMPRVFRHHVHKIGTAEVPPTIGVIHLYRYKECRVSDCMHCTRRLGKCPSKQTLVVAARCYIHLYACVLCSMVNGLRAIVADAAGSGSRRRRGTGIDARVSIIICM